MRKILIRLILGKSYYQEIKKIGEQMAVKAIKWKYNLYFDGKTVEQLYNHLTIKKNIINDFFNDILSQKDVKEYLEKISKIESKKQFTKRKLISPKYSNKHESN
jgi:hypothetical protein